MTPSIAQLIELLNQHGVSTACWGTGKAKTLGHLLKEIEEGETSLEVSPQGLRRVIRIASITVTSPTGRVLTEDRQEFADGRVRRRDLPGLSEKFKPGEDAGEAARRGIIEELSLPETAVLILNYQGKELKKSESPSFPGLLTEYWIENFAVELSEELYCEEGYKEIQPDKTTFFAWQ